MKKNKVFLKQLRDLRKWKYNLKRKRKRKKIRVEKLKNKPKKEKDIKKKKTIKKSAPENFSFVNNVNDTIQYFTEIDEVVKTNKEEKIFVDLSQVKNVTIDAIMYLLAILDKINHSSNLNRYFYGNSPMDKVANNDFIESGFYDYVKSKLKTPINKKKVKIYNSTKFDTEILKIICNFIVNNSSYEKHEVHFIYEIISEMMTNTFQHAYGENFEEDNKWYIYLEEEPNIFKFIFLDTGLGIPFTINKRLSEKVKEMIIPTDDKLLFSALKGEYRTRTKKENRGKGLKFIKENADIGLISNFFVISNRGVIKYKDNVITEKMCTEQIFQGTLYYWEVKK